MFTKIHTFRVTPKQELISEIAAYCSKNRIKSGIVLGIIGSLESSTLNYLKTLPGNYHPVDYKGPLEIVCAQGSVAQKDNETIIHIHIQLSNEERCFGGHFAEGIIFSTAEVCIGELDTQLHRQFDSYTGLNEIVN
jgi:uncharacterized protein